VFPVEIRIAEDALTARMATMREWLDHQRFEPAVFRYTFTSPGILFRVEFTLEAQAEAFAKAFDGQVQ
jgi:hypothetical protein